MLGFINKSSGQHAAIAQVKAWTRARFALTDDTVILAAEITCNQPGCPPLETVVAFWTDADTRHQFKVFKPAAEVVEDDLPPAWMKPRLIVDPDAGLTCC
jgi:nitrate reductase delta subunit